MMVHSRSLTHLFVVGRLVGRIFVIRQWASALRQEEANTEIIHDW